MKKTLCILLISMNSTIKTDTDLTTFHDKTTENTSFTKQKTIAISCAIACLTISAIIFKNIKHNDNTLDGNQSNTNQTPCTQIKPDSVSRQLNFNEDDSIKSTHTSIEPILTTTQPQINHPILDQEKLNLSPSLISLSPSPRIPDNLSHEHTQSSDTVISDGSSANNQTPDHTNTKTSVEIAELDRNNPVNYPQHNQPLTPSEANQHTIAALFDQGSTSGTKVKRSSRGRSINLFDLQKAYNTPSNTNTNANKSKTSSSSKN